MTPLVAGLLGGLAGNYFSGDKEKSLLDMFGKNAKANPKTMTDPQTMIGGQLHVGNQPQQQQQPQQTQPPQQGGGFMDSAKSFFNDEEKMTALAVGLNSMRHKPDANLATHLENRMTRISGKNKASKTAALLEKTNPQIAALLRSNAIDAKTAIAMAYKAPSSQQEKIDLYNKDPEAFAKLKAAGVVGSSGVNINMGDKTNMEFTKAGIADAKAQMSAGYSADNSLRDIALLRKLGSNPILQEVPDMTRGFIPQGYSPAIDAYNGQLDKVAKGLRQAGEGVMTEKDFEVLQQTSGAASMNIQAREILQSSLEETAKRQIERSSVASQFMSQQVTLSEYYNKMSELKNRPMFTSEQTDYINSLEGMMGYGALNETEKQSVPQKKWNMMSMQEREAFINARGK